MLGLLEPFLDLAGEGVAQPEHQERADRRGEEVGQEQLEGRQAEDAGRQVGRRPEADGEPAEDQDLDPVPVEVPLDLCLARPGQELPGQRQAQDLLAVEVAEEVDHEVADQDPGEARAQRRNPVHRPFAGQDRRQDDRGLLGDGQAQPTQHEDEEDPEVAEL